MRTDETLSPRRYFKFTSYLGSTLRPFHNFIATYTDILVTISLEHRSSCTSPRLISANFDKNTGATGAQKSLRFSAILLIFFLKRSEKWNNNINTRQLQILSTFVSIIYGL